MNNHVYFKATPHGEKLELTYEQEHCCKLVYKKNPNGKGYFYHGYWNIEENVDYSDEYVIVPLRSVYAGKASYSPYDIFANVIGSDPDPRHGYNSWISLFRQKNIPCSVCATDGYFYDSGDESARMVFNNVYCNNSSGIVGGHVINEFDADSVQSGGTVYLLPICKHHNSYCLDGTGKNGSGFFMMPSTYGEVIILSNYLE